jgi:hypothetical protein
MPADAAAASCVFPSIRFLRNTPTCASFTMEPHHLAPLLCRAVGTATTGKSNCRYPADLIVVDQGPSRKLIDAVVEMKRRNPHFGCRKIAEQIVSALGIDINKDVVRRILLRYYRPAPGGDLGILAGFSRWPQSGGFSA